MDIYIVYETQIKVGFQYIWLWAAIIEPKHREILLLIDVSVERTMLIVAECFISPLIDKYGKHHISTEMEEPGIHFNPATF